MTDSQSVETAVESAALVGQVANPAPRAVSFAKIDADAELAASGLTSHKARRWQSLDYRGFRRCCSKIGPRHFTLDRADYFEWLRSLRCSS